MSGLLTFLKAPCGTAEPVFGVKGHYKVTRLHVVFWHSVCLQCDRRHTACHVASEMCVLTTVNSSFLIAGGGQTLSAVVIVRHFHTAVRFNSRLCQSVYLWNTCDTCGPCPASPSSVASLSSGEDVCPRLWDWLTLTGWRLPSFTLIPSTYNVKHIVSVRPRQCEDLQLMNKHRYSS